MKQLTRRLSQQATFTDASPSILAVDKQEIYLQKLEFEATTLTYLDFIVILSFYFISIFILDLQQIESLKGSLCLILFVICLPGLFLTFPDEQLSFGEGSLIFQCLLLSIFCNNSNTTASLISICSVIALMPGLLRLKKLPYLEHLFVLPLLSLWMQQTISDYLTLEYWTNCSQFFMDNWEIITIWICIGLVSGFLVPK